MRGSNKGVSVPAPGVWPVAVQDKEEASHEFITVVDIEAQNGVVHVIDTVILPELTPTNVEDFEQMTLNFYPNPAVDRITFQSDEIGGIIRLIDISGKLLLEKQVRQYSQPVELNGIKSGVYFISLQNGNSLITKKLIVR